MRAEIETISHVHKTIGERALSLHNSRDKMAIGRKKKTNLKLINKQIKGGIYWRCFTKALGRWGRQPGRWFAYTASGLQVCIDELSEKHGSRFSAWQHIGPITMAIPTGHTDRERQRGYVWGYWAILTCRSHHATSHKVKSILSNKQTALWATAKNVKRRDTRHVWKRGCM